jgi:aldehyde dehydrogenase family protein
MPAPLDELSRQADAFAQLPPAAKATLIGACKNALAAAAPAWVADACQAKGLDMSAAGEEWLTGPLPSVRMAYLLERSLEAIARDGKPPLGNGTFTGPGGRLAIDLFPTSAFDRALFPGFSGYALMQAGIDAAEARRRQASFFDRRDPAGEISLVLGAGNVSSIPPMDVFTKMFIEGKVCLLKMNPVNAWLGPHLERGLEPLLSRGFLRIVYGGADVGASLAHDERVRDVHLTGSGRTHDTIVWGPPGPDRDRRKAQNTPLLDKHITSELGNVGPVVIVPHDYSDEELKFQARNVVTMITNNAGFNCNAAHVVITSSLWPQRERFFDVVARTFATIRPRKAYYPGARDRHAMLTAGRKRVEYFGEPRDGELPWALVRDVDSQDTRDRAFHTEPFCGLASETALPSQGPIEFLDRATRFVNDTLWGTLNACLIVPPPLERDNAFKSALDRSLVELRYGTVGINHWPGIGYGATSLPWGAYPGSMPTDIQSGRGWVHNTYMLEGIDKAVIRGPLRARPTPVWFTDNHASTRIGPRVVDLQANPAWRKMPGLLLRALGG